MILPGVSQAEEADTAFRWKNISVAAGYTMWVAKWESPNFNQLSGQVTQDNSEYAVMNGPTVAASVKLRDSDWFHSIWTSFQWLSTGFDFQTTGTPVVTPGTQIGPGVNLQGGLTITERSPVATRRDLTITAGVNVWRGLSIFAGYYDNKQKFTINTVEPPGVTLANNPERVTKRLQGPIFGISATAPVTRRIGAYGNLAMALLDFEPLESGTKASQGFSTELGVTIAGPHLWMADELGSPNRWGVQTLLRIGFRAQIISESFGANEFPREGFRETLGVRSTASVSGQKANDITWGPIFTLTAKF